MKSRTRSRKPASIGSNHSSRRPTAISASEPRTGNFVLLLAMAWSPPAHNAGIVWVSAPGDYATFNSNHTPDGTDFDLRAYFDNGRHDRLLEKVAQRVDDKDIMHLLKLMLKASGKKGVPQGGVISPLLSNLYLNEVDKMLERAREVTRNGKYTNVEYARFADDLVVLIHAYKRHDWLIGAVNKRLREEFAKLQVEINDEKSRRVDLERGENFGFLGFDFRYLRGLRGVMRPHYTPKLKKRTALLRELKQVFRRHRSQPIERVISLINPMLRGWVNYFAVGNSSECFTYIRDWVEKKVRRHLAQARKRKGFGWERWSRPWLYVTLGLFNSYRVRHDGPKVAPV